MFVSLQKVAQKSLVEIIIVINLCVCLTMEIFPCPSQNSVHISSLSSLFYNSLSRICTVKEFSDLTDNSLIKCRSCLLLLFHGPSNLSTVVPLLDVLLDVGDLILEVLVQLFPKAVSFHHFEGLIILVNGVIQVYF
jgi:hypothetical protein